MSQEQSTSSTSAESTGKPKRLKPSKMLQRIESRSQALDTQFTEMISALQSMVQVQSRSSSVAASEQSMSPRSTSTIPSASQRSPGPSGSGSQNNPISSQSSKTTTISHDSDFQAVESSFLELVTYLNTNNEVAGEMLKRTTDEVLLIIEKNTRALEEARRKFVTYLTKKQSTNNVEDQESRPEQHQPIPEEQTQQSDNDSLPSTPIGSPEPLQPEVESNQPSTSGTSTSKKRKKEEDRSTKWTIKHTKPGDGLIELMPNTNVYVSELKLMYCGTASNKDMKKFARLLMGEVFTKRALETCSFTGIVPKAHRGAKHFKPKPGLDPIARNAVLQYVLKYGAEQGWSQLGEETIKTSLKNKLSSENRKK